MVYPILKINQDDYEIELVDTQGELEFTIQAEDTVSLFYDLLNLLIEQYGYGYSNGYIDGIND